MTQHNSSTIIKLLLNPHYQNSKLLTSHYFMFNPACTTCKLPLLAGTHSYVYPLYFVKRNKPKFAIRHQLNFAIQERFFYSPFGSYTFNSLLFNYTVFQPLFNIWPTESLEQQFLAKWTQNYQEGQDFNAFTLYIPWILYPPNPFHLLPSFHLTVTSLSIYLLSSMIILRSFQHQNPSCVFYDSVGVLS